MAERDLGFPTEVEELGHVEELAGGAVGFGGVEGEGASVAEDVADGFGELADGDVVSAADIDNVGGVVVFEKEVAGVGEVINVEEFATRSAGAPDEDGGVVGLLGEVDLADEGGEDVGGVEVEVVEGAVEIRRHPGDEVAAVLARVGLAESDAGDFGEGVGFVGGFEGAGEEGVFADGLVGEFRVDAGAAEEEEFADVELVRGGDEIVLDGEVFEEKFDGLFVVRDNAADFCGGDDDDGGAVFFVERVDGGGVLKIEFGAGGGEDVFKSLGLEAADDGAADHAAMSGDVN